MLTDKAPCPDCQPHLTSDIQPIICAGGAGKLIFTAGITLASVADLILETDVGSCIRVATAPTVQLVRERVLQKSMEISKGQSNGSMQGG